MNGISFKGLYKLHTYSHAVCHVDQIELRERLRSEFKKKDIKAVMEIEIFPDRKVLDPIPKEILGHTPCTLSIISYGTPEQDYEVFNEVFGKNLGYMKTLNRAKKRFTPEFMETFKSAVQKLFDKHMKALDLHITNQRVREELKSSATRDKLSAGFFLNEFKDNAIDINVRTAK